MKEIIELLQKEVYRKDRLIGNLADDLRVETRSDYDKKKDLENYNIACKERYIMLRCIEDLKQLG